MAAAKDYPPPTLEDAERALFHIPADCPEADWWQLGATLAAEFPGAAGFAVFDQWSQTAPEKYDAADLKARWRKWERHRGNGKAMGTFFDIAKRYGYRPEPSAAPPSPAELARRQQERAERERQRQAAEAEEREAAAHAEARAAREYAKAPLAPPSHGHLVRKGIEPHGLRLFRGNLEVAGMPLDGCLMVPAFDLDGTVKSLQFIHPNIPRKDGKRNLPKASIKGRFWRLGEFTAAGRVYIAEGPATAASIHEATGECTLCAFSKGNLEAVAVQVRERYPAARIVFAPDNDADGGGLESANAAARTVGGCVAPPPPIPPGEKKGDYNDLAQREGPEVIRAILEAAAPPAPQEGPPPTEEPPPPPPAAPADPADKTPADGGDSPAAGDKPKKPTQADTLLSLASRYEYFHDPDGIGYARVRGGNGKQVFQIRGKSFKDLLRKDYYHATGKGIGNQALQDAVETLDAKAQFEGEECKVYQRVARMDDALIIDLASAENLAVIITKSGWRITNNPPVDFRRSRNMAAITAPIKGGNLTLLRRFLNVSDDGFTLIVSWILGALRGQDGYPILAIQGEAGTGKSTITKIIRYFTDPSTVPLKSIPAQELDLAVMAANGYVIAFDNLSALKAEQSDWLCRISTGFGFSKKANYTDFDEASIHACNPIILNGISPSFNRPDLISRMVAVELFPFPSHQENDESKFWAELEAVRDLIFGAICDALSVALRNESAVKVGRRVRLGGFARWVIAAEPALSWPAGTFLNTFAGSQQNANATALNSSPIGAALYKFITERKHWDGTATELLTALTADNPERAKERRYWPGSPEAMGSKLKELAPALRDVGISYERQKGGSRTIYLDWTPQQPPKPPEPSFSSPKQPDSSNQPTARPARTAQVSNNAPDPDDCETF
jgi:hypothetical protein